MRELVSKSEVNAAIQKIAANINENYPYPDETPLVLCVMIGGMYFTNELTKQLTFPIEINYLHASRYGGNTQGGTLSWKAKPTVALTGRHIIVVDDIIDKGITLNEIIKYLNKQNPASIKTAVLVDKVNCRDSNGLNKADFTGIELSNDPYVVGCGMDYKKTGRNQPFISEVFIDVTPPTPNNTPIIQPSNETETPILL